VVTVVRAASGDQLDTRTLHDLLALRGAVFVVEQACPYLDVDGLDLLASTTHLWIDDGDELVAALRLLGGDPPRIGRVATAPAARGQGLAAALVRDALARCEGRARLEAQTPLVGWYRSLGFEVVGDEYVDDGIAHTPMASAKLVG
jgi:ElaA protein